jgi:hypothetical protein
MTKPAKVWNDNSFPFTQKYQDQIINVPAKGYVEMPWDDAHQFLGLFFQPVYDGMGQQKPDSFKMLRVEGQSPQAQAQTQVCAACGDEFTSEDRLNAHIDRHHLDEMEDQKLAQKRKVKRAVKDGATL